jgi:hypothetical protein
MMKDWVGEAETDVNSPHKQFQISAKRTPAARNHLLGGGQGGKLSVTEQQLYSRGIVREVLMRGKACVK